MKPDALRVAVVLMTLAGGVAADLKPARTIEGTPVYVLTGYPAVADLAGIVNKTPAPFFVVRGDWPRAAELTGFVHFGAPATLVAAARRYPKPHEGVVLVHAPPALRIIVAHDRLPTADEVRDLRHVGRRLEILLPAALSGELDALLKDVPSVGSFSGSAALRTGLLQAAGIRSTAPGGRRTP